MGCVQAVQSVFLFKDFITLTRKGNADWQPILAKAAGIIGVAEDADAKLLAQVSQAQVTTPTTSATNPQPTSNLGQVEVAVQLFRGIPVQVRAIAVDGQQARVALCQSGLTRHFNELLVPLARIIWFDVRVEMMAALERIEGGGETQIPMWLRITQGGVAKPMP